MGRRAAGVLAAAAATAAALAAAGCGAGETKTVTVGAPGATQAGTTTVQTTPGQPPAERVLAARQARIDDDNARLEILELRRSGRTAALTVRVSNTNRRDFTGSMYIADELGDGITDSATGNDDDAFDGPSLVDAKNAKRYRVARDSTGACLCDTNLGVGTSLTSGSSLTLSATFGAPPDDVSAVDVHVPRFGTFKDVPIS